jgi:hypothetical protein
MTDDDYKYIYTKRRVYRLAKDAGGIPIEEVYPGAEMPEFLKGALVYETPRGRIIARQESDERGSQADGENARAEGRQGMVRIPRKSGHAMPLSVRNRRPNGKRPSPIYKTIRCASSARTHRRGGTAPKRATAMAISSADNDRSGSAPAI